jgi:mRNA-degrading endonuclease toxin of MazEF toxin-antitoxin module
VQPAFTAWEPAAADGLSRWCGEAKSGWLDRNSKAQAEKMRTVDIQRIVAQLGQLPGRLAHALQDALRLHLQL